MAQLPEDDETKVSLLKQEKSSFVLPMDTIEAGKGGTIQVKSAHKIMNIMEESKGDSDTLEGQFAGSTAPR